MIFTDQKMRKILKSEYFERVNEELRYKLRGIMKNEETEQICWFCERVDEELWYNLRDMLKITIK